MVNKTVWVRRSGEGRMKRMESASDRGPGSMSGAPGWLPPATVVAITLLAFLGVGLVFTALFLLAGRALTRLPGRRMLPVEPRT